MTAATYNLTINNPVNEELAWQDDLATYNAASIAAMPNFVPLTMQQYMKQVLNDQGRLRKLAYKAKLQAIEAAKVTFDPNA